MKVGQIREVKFFALRVSMDGNIGVMFDCDEQVTRKCVVCLDECGLKKWQVVRRYRNQHEWDYYLESDQECLNNADFDEINKENNF